MYYLVNDRFREVVGRDYLGSRDIDLGFHIDLNWSKGEFDNSAFNRSMAKIKQMGFETDSYRFVKRYHLSERRELTAEEKRKLPQYDTFNLYIDMLVDSDDPRRHELAGFTVLEEPLLNEIFEKKNCVEKTLFDVNIMMPSPELLIRMKVKSFPLRTQDDKRTKDLADICTLLLYSGTNATILNDKSSVVAYSKALDKTTEEQWKFVADALGLDLPLAKRAARRIGTF